MSAAPKKKIFTPSECPVCGADVPAEARACPECGADERAGWNEEDTRYDGLDLPADAFEDNASGSANHARPQPARINGIALHWWVLAVLLLGGLIFGALGLGR